MSEHQDRNAKAKAKRDANAAAGLCRCGQAREGDWKLCRRCRDVVKAKSARRHHPEVKEAIRWLEQGLGDVIEMQNPEVEVKLRYVYRALLGPDDFNDRCITAVEESANVAEAKLALAKLQDEAFSA